MAQKIPASSTLFFGAVIEPSIPPATLSISLIPLLDPAVESPAQSKNQRQSISIPPLLLNLGLNPSKRLANCPIIEPATNLDPNTLHLDSSYDENKASVLEALAEDVCNADKDVAPAGKKRTLAKDTCDADEDVALARKKKT